MIVPGSANPLLMAGGGYQISRSVRLRSSASAYLNRTYASAGSTTSWTLSAWVKRGALAAANPQDIFRTNYTATYHTGVYFSSSDTLNYVQWTGSTAINLQTTQVFRDPSAWYHIVLAVDTTQATASNRVKLYVNGVQVTSFATATYPAQNSDTYMCSSTGWTHTIGRFFDFSTTSYFDGYITEVNFIDGQALTPSSFGQTDPITGVWTPKKYAGTYGTNGFYLNFSDNSAATAAAIGADKSGNGNNWTPNNISLTAGVTYDSMIDTPTPYADGGNGRGNYGVINPVAAGVDATITNANLSISYGTASSPTTTLGTFGMSSGKWYWENTITASTLTACTAFVGLVNQSNPTGAGSYPGATSRGWSYYGNLGNFYNNNATIQTGLATFGATNDVVGVAFDADAGTLQFYKNGTQIGTTITGIAADTYFPAWSDGSQANTFTVAVNFGQRPFTYTPPTGFQALNTQNLPTPTIRKGNTWFDATPYTGTNAAGLNIVNAGAFQPDLVWIKSRSVASTNHALYDSARTLGYYLMSNQTNAEGIPSPNDAFLSFNSNGFSLGANSNAGSPNINFTNGGSYIAWQWKKGATPGFDIVTFTGTGAAGFTANHSLGVAPSMIIVKRRDAANDWPVYHKSLGNTQGIYLDLTNAAGASSAFWNNTSPTSTQFTMGASSMFTGSCVAYLFAEVAGFSKFGSYTGNGSADGPFVYCGFRPRFVMVKRADAAGNDWWIMDTARSTYNQSVADMLPSSSAAEYTVTGGVEKDVLSNGFKLRNTGTGNNASGGTYIFAAFAENPFKYSLAR